MKSNVSSTAILSPDTPEAGNTPEQTPEETPEYLRAMAELTAVSIAPAIQPKTILSEYFTEPLSEDTISNVSKLLGVDKKTWNRLSAGVLRQTLPRIGLTKIVARLSLRTGFDSLDHASKVAEIGRGIMEDPTKPAELRILCGKVISQSVEAMSKMFPQLMTLAEQAADRIEGDDGTKVRPKNLPPQVTANVQVNVGAAPSPAAPTPVNAIDISSSASAKTGTGTGNKPPKSKNEL